MIAQVLVWHESGLDFADAFHLAYSQHRHAMYTFDNKFVKCAEDTTKCEIKNP
jgi:predicted nucleic acid-binding protein